MGCFVRLLEVVPWPDSSLQFLEFGRMDVEILQKFILWFFIVSCLRIVEVEAGGHEFSGSLLLPNVSFNTWLNFVLIILEDIKQLV